MICDFLDGIGDSINGLLGGAAGTNYGENNSLMAITRNYSVAVLMAAGVIAILLGFVGKLAALVLIIVPVGFGAAGLPMGMQLMGRPQADIDVLRLAYAYENG